MAAVAVGWQVYAIRQEPARPRPDRADGVPAAAAARAAGRAARRPGLADGACSPLSLVLEIARVRRCSSSSASPGAKQLWPFLVLAAATGVAGALGCPPARALPATLVPLELIPSAMALRSIAFQAAVVAGPGARRRPLHDRARRPSTATAALLLVAGLGCMLARPRAAGRARRRGRAARARERRSPGSASSAARRCCSARSRSTSSPSSSAAPSRCCRCSRARSSTPGPSGSASSARAPAVGAVAGRASGSRTGRCSGTPGRTLLVVVAIVRREHDRVRALDARSPLSLAALAVSGFVDMISMNIRGTTVALATPGRAARARDRGRDGVHQRLERARRVRVRASPRRSSARSRPSSPAA